MEKTLSKVLKFSVVTNPVPGLTEVLSVPFSILKLLLFHLFLECQHPASKLTLNAAFRDEICPGGRHVPQGLITTCSAMSKAYEIHLLGKASLLSTAPYVLENHPLQVLPFISQYNIVHQLYFNKKNSVKRKRKVSKEQSI